MTTVREAQLAHDVDAVKQLWLDYLTWGNNEMQARHGVHPHDPQIAVENDMAHISKFLPPTGYLLLAFQGDVPCGIGCMQKIGPETCEIKRMYVAPDARRGGVGRAILDALVARAQSAGYKKIRLDSPEFMTAAHSLYRSCGFREIEAYPESEIPAEFRKYLVFMERDTFHDPQRCSITILSDGATKPI